MFCVDLELEKAYFNETNALLKYFLYKIKQKRFHKTYFVN